MSWNANPRDRAGAFAAWLMRLEHGQHHLPDHCRRALHVVAQVFPGLIRGRRQIHGHGVEEAVEALRVDARG